MSTQTVLVAGAGGMLGGRIAAHLSEEPDTRLRLMVRPGGRGADDVTLADLVARGAEMVEADLTDPASLDRATQSVDVIVSAVQGGRDIMVAGQLALLTAASRNGVRRILPSDFALDLFRSPPGEHANFDMRREADEAIAATGIEHVNILNGSFMDNFLHSQFAGVFDMEKGTATFWGDGNDPFDATSVEDTARYTARAAVDRNLPSGKFALAGEQLTFNGIIDVVEHVSGRTFERRSQGTIADLKQTIARQRAADPDSMAALGNTYILYMLDGTTALTDLQNGRYLDLRPETYRQHVERTWEQAK